MSIVTSFLSPRSNRRGKVAPVDQMYLDEIPGAMDKMGWRVSAALMRRWFATKPAWVMSQRDRVGINATLLPASRVENQLVKMDWLLGHESVIPAFERLCQGWITQDARDLLQDHLRSVGWRPGVATRLGYGIRTAMQADQSCQVNYMTFGSYLDRLDDLFGALNKGTFKLAVMGQTSRSLYKRKDVFEIEKIGVYCRDTYDFNEDWYRDKLVGLGVWSRRRCLSKAEMAIHVASPSLIKAMQFPGFVPPRYTQLLAVGAPQKVVYGQ